MVRANSFDGDKLKTLLTSKGIKHSEFANMVGISNTQISRYLSNDKKPTPAEMKCFCFALGCSEEDLMPSKIESTKVVTATQIIATDELRNEMSNLKKQLEAITTDLSTMANVLLNVQKVNSEAKAQAELNREMLEVISNKQTQTNSIVSQINAKVRGKY